MFQIFYFLQSDMVLEIVNLISGIFNVISLTYIDVRIVQFIPPESEISGVPAVCEVTFHLFVSSSVVL